MREHVASRTGRSKESQQHRDADAQVQPTTTAPVAVGLWAERQPRGEVGAGWACDAAGDRIKEEVGRVLVRRDREAKVAEVVYGKFGRAAVHGLACNHRRRTLRRQGLDGAHRTAAAAVQRERLRTLHAKARRTVGTVGAF